MSKFLTVTNVVSSNVFNILLLNTKSTVLVTFRVQSVFNSLVDRKDFHLRKKKINKKEFLDNLMLGKWQVIRITEV